jgi:hypothetical protein
MLVNGFHELAEERLVIQPFTTSVFATFPVGGKRTGGSSLPWIIFSPLLLLGT